MAIHVNNGALRPPALVKTFVILAIGCGLVALCYVFVDRPLARFVEVHQFPKIAWLKWVTLPPPILQSWAPAVLCLLMVRRAWGPWRLWERTLLAASVGMILADQFRESLALVAGRTWPDTWIDHNPSYLGDGVFGFHPFHGGEGYASFPSGHEARTLALVLPVWIAYPAWRWFCIVAATLVAIGLAGMNYHFMGDILAGGFVGGIVGYYTAWSLGIFTKWPPRTDQL